MKSAEQIKIQAAILQQQLAQMADRKQTHSPLFHEGMGKLKAAAWVLEVEKAEETLAFDNRTMKFDEAIWG